MKVPKLKYLIILYILITINKSAFGQNYPRGLDFNDSAYAMVPRKAPMLRDLDAIPSQASLKDYAPHPKTQGEYLTCTAWACAYCARTMVDAIKNNWTNKDSITAKAYSPGFLFRLLSPNDNVCSAETDMQVALQMMKSKGCIPYHDMPSMCVPIVANDQLGKANNYRIRDFARLFDVSSFANVKIQAVKKAISEKKPVVIGIICPPSFNHAYHNWQPTEQPLSSFGGHALCVVGYDDNQYGGAFEVQNSWGENWGFEGYTWISYQDFARFVRYGYELIDMPDAKPDIADLSGSIKLVLTSGAEMPANLLVSTRGLTVVSAQKTPDPLTIYQTANAYESGTRFSIYISNDQPAYVYAISSDLGNNDAVLFPFEKNMSAAFTYKKNAFAIPENGCIEFDKKPGKDFLCVLYSRSELNINDIIAKISAEQGSFNQRIFKVMGDRIVDPGDIKFTNDKIAFQAYSKGKDVLAMMVELDHK